MSLHDTTLTPRQEWVLNTNHLLLRSLRHPALQQLGQRCLDGVLHDARPVPGLNTDQWSEERRRGGGRWWSLPQQQQPAPVSCRCKQINESVAVAGAGAGERSGSRRRVTVPTTNTAPARGEAPGGADSNVTPLLVSPSLATTPAFRYLSSMFA